MTRPRAERLATRPCPATITPQHSATPNLDAIAAALVRELTVLDCGCWLVVRPDGTLTVPCAAHDDEWWEE